MSWPWPASVDAITGVLGVPAEGSRDAVLRRVVTDSRAGVGEGDLFVGLQGPRFDGGAFAADALADGATGVIVAHGAPSLPLGAGQVRWTVSDPLAALHALARWTREAYPGQVIGITGSNGKTTVKEMIRAALTRPGVSDSPRAGSAIPDGSAPRLYASPMSYNSQVGVALSLLHLDPTTDVALIECGVSEVGEMARLERMVAPDAGVFVNVGDAHLEGLGGRDGVLREKLGLFRRVTPEGGVVAPSTQPEVVSALADRAVLATVDDPSDPWGETRAIALVVAERLGVDRAMAERGLARWSPSPMRLELTETPGGVLVINDAYTNDAVSAVRALEALGREHSTGKAIAVLGTLQHAGHRSGALYAKIGEAVARTADRLVVVGRDAAPLMEHAIAAGMSEAHAVLVDEVEAAAEVTDAWVDRGDRVLLKGSRAQGLEALATRFFGAVAPTRLYVSLERYLANLDRVRARIGRNVGVMAVVKSYGYGVDASRIAIALRDAGVEHFAVAYPDEAVLLRDRKITTPILVQNVLPHEVDKVVRYGLSAQVGDDRQLAWIEAAAARAQRSVRVHVKVDTGMGRAGYAPADAAEAIARVRASEWLHLDGVMTHFASADDPAADAATRAQIRAFDEVLSAIHASRNRKDPSARTSSLQPPASSLPRWVHASNSAGVIRFPEARYSMVRMGIGLYGYSEAPDVDGLGLEPTLRLVSRVVSVKTLPAGHGVGYGSTFVATRPTTIAVVAIGYNDGYPWSLGNKGWMSISGHRFDVVGRVCMDVTMLDVSEAPMLVQAGDDVVVFGDREGEPRLEEVAALAGTIPYEVLTRISGRVRRIFAREM